MDLTGIFSCANKHDFKRLFLKTTIFTHFLDKHYTNAISECIILRFGGGGDVTQR